MRVLHVLRSLDQGGVEAWLMNMLRHTAANGRDVNMDFATHATSPGAYEEEAEALGARVYRCPSYRNPWKYGVELRGVLRTNGPYDAVHSHLHHFSGTVLRIAAQTRVPIRIAHSHADSSTQDGTSGHARQLYLRLMRRWIDRNATLGFAASGRAASALFGPLWEHDRRWRKLLCGIDLEPFRLPVDRAAVRREIGLPEDAFVVAHVGRGTPAKNHSFLFATAREMLALQPSARLLLIGGDVPQSDGPVNVVFAGERGDVARLLQAADAFVFPSLHEGLGLALVEAQAAGLPYVASDHVPAEADVVPRLGRRLPLSAGPRAWAEALLQPLDAQPCREDCLLILEASGFNLQHSLNCLLAELRNAHKKGGSVGASV